MAKKSIQFSQLKSALQKFLEGYFAPEIAQHCVDVILYAELRGKGTQGLLKLVGTEPLQDIVVEEDIAVEERTKLSAVIAGNRNAGFHVAKVATDICLEKVKENGMGIVGAHGIYTSTGAIGYYVEQLADAGFVGYCCARSPGAMAPFGLSVPLFGTNPFAWSFPTNERSIVFDMATSAVTFYDLILAKMRGEKIPADVAVDKFGKLTDDPAAAMDGGILPFDKGYKGSALSMMVEVLSGPLVGASFCDYETFEEDWGFFIFGIDPEILVDREAFKVKAGMLVREIRKHGGQVPSDNGIAHEKRVLKDGVLEIEDDVASLLGI